jgi:hypothetical protein
MIQSGSAVSINCVFVLVRLILRVTPSEVFLSDFLPDHLCYVKHLDH